MTPRRLRTAPRGVHRVPMSSNTLIPIAVTGYGSISAAGRNCTEALNTLEKAQVRNRPTAAPFFPAGFSAPCFLASDPQFEEFSALGDRDRSGFDRSNRTIRLALAAIDEALVHSGITVAEMTSVRVGIALGTTVGCTFHNEEYYIDWKEGRKPKEEQLFNYFASNLAESVQTFLGVQGPRLVITNACASGTDAIGMAFRWLQHGFCDIAIAGGADELSKVACHGFNSLMLVSAEDCRPFDRNRQGLNLGEGAGVFIMERQDRALREKRQVYGWLRGYGIAGDGYHPTAPHPEGIGLQKAMTAALEEAALSVKDIAMINAHGTGTRANDTAETCALAKLGFDTSGAVIASTKGATGHTLGAAGGVEAVFTLLALNGGKVWGTISCLGMDESLACPVLPHGTSAVLSGRLGLSQSLAFGGSNSALVIEGSG